MLANQDITNYANGTAELSRPAYITLSWNTEIDEAYASENSISSEVGTYTLYFDKSDDFSEAQVSLVFIAVASFSNSSK